MPTDDSGMGGALIPPRPAARLFVIYAVVSLVPVAILGLVLAASFRREATRRGLAEGRSEAALIAQIAVEPLLEGHPLSRGLTRAESTAMVRMSSLAVAQHDVLRLRLRDLAGQVVFSNDRSGAAEHEDDEALSAAAGHVVARLTRLNSDANDTGRVGVAAVEVYLPLRSGVPAHRVGVLELYIPYAPISNDIASGLRMLYLELAIGLAVLYLALFVITASVTRRLRREAVRNAFLAAHDVLTELPNRALFQQLARDQLADVIGNSGSLVIAIVDLDSFKAVNDTLGHRSGDQLLTEIARRLAEHVGMQDTCARLGGDEFGLILPDVSDPEEVLEGVRGLIAREVEIAGLPLSVAASIGYAIAPADGRDIDILLQRADVAMYAAKARHAGIVRYHASLEQYDAASLSLIGELRNAIEQDQLVLHYQPLKTLADGRITTVEALVRWQHPRLGLLPPDRFLPMAEQTDLIDSLTAWVLRTALRETRELGPDGRSLTVAINISARSISRSSLATDVLQALRELQMPPERLMLEVTETALLSDPQRAGSVIRQLANAGVRTSLDDFGSGHTSLGYLSALPIHELKIDRSFVADMLENHAHEAIVRSIIELGHNLGLTVVGEGVETEDLLDALQVAGCDTAQGFVLARPMPVNELNAWLRPTRHLRVA